MIISRYQLLRFIYSDDFQYRFMRLQYSNYNDLEFMEEFRKYYTNIQLIRKGVFAI